VADYRAMFPSVGLEHLHDYVDLGERVSVLAGRKRVSPAAGRAQSVLIYTDSLRAPSETFVTGLIDCVSEARPDLTVLTHRLYGPQSICGSATADWRVTVIPRDLPRWRPAWFANVAMRALADRELFEWSLRRFLARRPYDVIHAQFGQPGYYIYRALAGDRRPATRLVVNFYGWDATGLPASVPVWRRRYEELFRYSNLAVVVEGPVMKTRVAGLGCPEDKIHVVPLCLARPTADRPAADRPEAGREPQVLGFVGRLVEKKGFAFALSALAPVLKARPQLRVVIVGDGPERTRIERLVLEHGLGSRVILKGMLPHPETLAEIEQMDALVVPSLTARDGDSEGGAPTIVAEAQIAGTSVIASDHADIPFSLNDHAYMFKEGDGRSLLEAVERYLGDSGRSYDIERARARTLEQHDGRRIRERYEAIYLGADRG
jgi:colanic acid/amylovoran biosynthesis glycosyltransferase